MAKSMLGWAGLSGLGGWADGSCGSENDGDVTVMVINRRDSQLAMRDHGYHENNKDTRYVVGGNGIVFQ
jgi:hypothetical protein